MVSVVLAGYALVGGLLSFTGWTTGNVRLTDWWGTGVTIKTNTSLCLAGLGAALLLYQTARARAVTMVLATLVGLVGIATTMETPGRARLRYRYAAVR